MHLPAHPECLTYHPQTQSLTLQILTGLGINGVFTAFMNWLAFRNWKIFLGGKPWKWDEEIAVVTGGSGGYA